MIIALQLLREAQKREWTFKVEDGYDEGPVETASAAKAWELVKGTDEAKVFFYDAGAAYLGWAYLMAPSPNTCADEESLVDYSESGNEFSDLCNELIEEAL